MVDLDGMMIAQLKERDASFPNIEKGVLVAMVCFFIIVVFHLS